VRQYPDFFAAGVEFSAKRCYLNRRAGSNERTLLYGLTEKTLFLQIFKYLQERFCHRKRQFQKQITGSLRDALSQVHSVCIGDRVLAYLCDNVVGVRFFCARAEEDDRQEQNEGEAGK